jgi:NAD(P)-dependent dehydrogenase (short-subunit alcohol dehydrogenase family)
MTKGEIAGANAHKNSEMRVRRKCMGRLEGKTALITGVNSCIGLATAKQFVNEGAHVFITGRRDPELTAAVMEIGRNVTAMLIEVSNLTDLDRLFSQIKLKGELDIVFANADAEFAPFGDIAEEHYHSILTNVKGLFFTIQKAFPLLSEGASVILNAFAVASREGAANWIFGATTDTIRSFARTWAMDLNDRRIRVNVISPGSIETPGSTAPIASTGADEQRLSPLPNRVMPRRPGTPNEAAKAAISLLCDESSDVTRTELFVDCGTEHLKVFPGCVSLSRLGAPDEIAKSVLFLASDDSSHITGMELFGAGGVAKL